MNNKVTLFLNRKQQSDHEEEEDRRKDDESGEIQLDFDLMMERKRKEKRRYRKRKDIALINDNDDAIARLIADMRQAARYSKRVYLKFKEIEGKNFSGMIEI